MDKKSSAQEIIDEVTEKQNEKFDVEKLEKKVHAELDQEAKEAVKNLK